MARGRVCIVVNDVLLSMQIKKTGDKERETKSRELLEKCERARARELFSDYFILTGCTRGTASRSVVFDVDVPSI
jgi:hypothetical protein